MSGATPLGFPYPTDTDLVQNVDEAIQDLAEACEGSGAWVTPALLNGWANLGAGFAPFRYRKVGGVVYVQGEVTGGTAAAIFVLPAGFRPASTVRFVGIANAVAKSIDILATGTINIGGTSLADMSLSCAFPAGV